MAFIPEHLKLTVPEEEQLEAIRIEARVRHEKARLAAKKKKLYDFPLLPYECSWAFEEAFRKRTRRLSRERKIS